MSKSISNYFKKLSLSKLPKVNSISSISITPVQRNGSESSIPQSSTGSESSSPQSLTCSESSSSQSSTFLEFYSSQSSTGAELDPLNTLVQFHKGLKPIQPVLDEYPDEYDEYFIFLNLFQIILNSSFLIITLLSFIRNNVLIPFLYNNSVRCLIIFFSFLFEAPKKFTNKKFPTNVF